MADLRHGESLGMSGGVLTMLHKSAEAVRARIVDKLRRDLIGPGPQDADIAREVLKENPSRWYLTGSWRRRPDSSIDAVEELEDEGDPIYGDDQAPTPRPATPVPPMMRRQTSRQPARTACLHRSA